MGSLRRTAQRATINRKVRRWLRQMAQVDRKRRERQRQKQETET